ncbi:MAG: type IV pilus modification protein PilV [Bermanella sp.]|jgi:type IV pilus modification protein PilV
MPLNTPQRQSGFAMLEALITSVIVAIGLSGVGVLLLKSVHSTQDSAQQTQAVWIVQDFVGRIRANSEGARNGQYVVDNDANTIDCDTLVTKMCAAHFIEDDDKSTSNTIADCDSNEMATFDKWITACDINDEIYDSPSDFIANPVLLSTCTLTEIVTDLCYQYQVQLTWDTTLVKGSSVAAERTNTNSYSIVVEVN